MKSTFVHLVLVSLSVVTMHSGDHELVFEDTFVSRLKPGWSWLREDPEGWRVTKDGLEIKVAPGNMWGGANDAKNVLTRPAPNDLTGTIEVSVRVSNRPTEQYEQVDLVWYFDDSHMVKIGQELVDGTLSIVMGREERDRTRTLAIIPITSHTVDLQFRVHGDMIRGLYRTAETEAWRVAGECDLPVQGDSQISLQAYQGPAKMAHWARITGFRVVKKEGPLN